MGAKKKVIKKKVTKKNVTKKGAKKKPKKVKKKKKSKPKEKNLVDDVVSDSFPYDEITPEGKDNDLDENPNYL